MSFAKKPSTNEAAAAVWKLADDGGDDDLINEDDLLDESDKIKPNPTDLRGNFTNTLKHFMMQETPISHHQHLVFLSSVRYNWEAKGMQRLFMWFG